MAFLKVIIFMLGLVSICKSASVLDNLTKCKVKDSECHKTNLKVMLSAAAGGISEYGIPPIDPMVLKDLNASIPNALNIYIEEGTVKGLKNSVVNKFEVDLEKLKGNIQVTCNLVMKGKYDISSSSDVIQKLLGGPIHGKGNGKIKIEQLKVDIFFPIEVEKREDDTYFKINIKKLRSTFEILGNVKFAADNVYLGDKESSKDMVALMNDNWDVVVKTFGKRLFDIALKYVYECVSSFFHHCPSKHFLVEDISSYVH